MSKAINLHYLLPPMLNRRVIEFNRMLVASFGSQVDFSGGKHIPHITLFMGIPKTSVEPEMLVSALLDQVKGLPSLHSRVDPPYLKDDRPNWAFLDVLPAEPLIFLKRKILAEMKSLIEPPTWDYTEEVPHVTIGYVTQSHDLARLRLGGLSYDDEVRLQRVEISHMGKRGTCIDPIAQREL